MTRDQYNSTSAEVKISDAGVFYRQRKGCNFLLTATDTSDMTTSRIKNRDELARPRIVGQTWTRQHSYVKKYIAESETISEEDIKDTDVDVLATQVRDIVRAVQKQVDIRIYDVLTESLSPSNIGTAAATGTGWDDTTNGNPVLDILAAKKNIRANSYDTNSLIMYINQHEELMLLNWLIKVKGSSIRDTAAEALVKIGKPSVEPLIDVLRDKDSSLQDKVTKALVKIISSASFLLFLICFKI